MSTTIEAVSSSGGSVCPAISRSSMAVVVVATALLLGSAQSWAHSYGAPSPIFRQTRPPSCNGCHRGGAVPIVTVTASAKELLPAALLVLTVSVTTPNGEPGAAGFDLRASQPGRFIVGGPASSGTMVVRGRNGWPEATHKASKAGEPAVFTALWTPAPAASGVVTFTAWGNAVDGNPANDGPLGDRAARATVDVNINVNVNVRRPTRGTRRGRPS